MDRIKSILLSLVFLQIPLLCFPQLLPNHLWHAKYVLDLSTGEKDKNIQSFISMESDSLVNIIYFKEYLKRETGEIEIYPIWDTVSIRYQKPLGSNLLINNEGDVEFEIASESDTVLFLADGNFRLEYRRLREEQKFFSRENLFQIIVENDFEVMDKAYLIPNERKIRFLDNQHLLHWKDKEDREKLFFRKDMPLYTKYLILEFNGYLLFKGITSYPKILLSVEEDNLRFVSYDTNKSERNIMIWKKIKM